MRPDVSGQFCVVTASQTNPRQTLRSNISEPTYEHVSNHDLQFELRGRHSDPVVEKKFGYSRVAQSSLPCLLMVF